MLLTAAAAVCGNMNVLAHGRENTGTLAKTERGILNDCNFTQ